MKKLSLLVFILLKIQTTAFSQSCLPEGITFETQARIDDFQSDYPGCSIIQGDVEILGTDISNLAGIGVIDSIYGNLIIGDEWDASNPELITLAGIENLSYVGGDLEINNNTNLVSISGLSGILKIQGDLRFVDNPVLASLAGLENLDSIFQVLCIVNNDLLLNLTGLNNLRYIGYFSCHGNDGLLDLEGLENLTRLDGCFCLGDNTAMTSLSGIPNLSNVDYIDFENTSLISLSGLESLDTIEGYLGLLDNDDLVSLEGLTNVKSINSCLWIENNYLLNNFDGLEGVTSIGGGLDIVGNNSLVSIEGLVNATADSLNFLGIRNNPNLSECNIQIICDYLAAPPDMISIYNNATGCDDPPEIAEKCGITLSCLPFGNYYFQHQTDIDNFPSDYSNCSQLNGNVNISGDGITNLDSLAGIDTINGSLSICSNDNLSSLYGLHNLRKISGSLYLGWYEYPGNNSLTSLEGLNNLYSVGNQMLIFYNDGLLTLSGLDSLTEIGGSLSVHDNVSLKNLYGMNHLKSAGSVYIYNNPSLLNLNGLQSLVNVFGDVSVSYNPAMFSINGIANIDANHITSLDIYHNDVLSNCDVQSVCDYLADPGGEILIIDNDTGCNNQEEVELACSVGVEEVGSQQSTISSYPNPVKDRVTFNIRLQESAKLKLTVYNSMGQIVATILDESLEKGDHLVTWNAGNLSPGICFYRLSTANCQLPTIGKLVITR